jgi:hypothetical protein
MKIAIVTSFTAIWNVEVNQDWFINELTLCVLAFLKVFFKKKAKAKLEGY